MKLWKRIIIAVLATMVIGASSILGACKAPSANEVLIWWPPGANSVTALTELLEDYKSKNPGFEYRIQQQASSDYYSKISNGLLANDIKGLPDIAKIDHTHVANFAGTGDIIELDELAQKHKDKFIENAIAGNTYNGKVYAMPFDVNTGVLIYNTDIVPQAPTTFDDFLAVCASASASNKTPFAMAIYANGNMSWSSFTINSWLERNGASIFNEDMTASNFDSPEVRDTIAKIKLMADNGYFNTTTYEESKFYNNAVGMIEMGQWSLNSLNGDNFGFAPYFKINAEKEPVSSLGMYSLVGLNKVKYIDNDTYTKKQEITKELIELISTDINLQLAYSKDERQLPSLKDGLEDAYFTSSPVLSVFADQVKKAVPRPSIPIWPEVEEAISEAFTNIFRSNRDIDSQVKACHNRINELLEEMRG